jgi:hypothetical protein
MNTLYELQPAIIEKLKSDVTLTGMVTGIFDDVPQGTDYPFVKVGESSETPRNTFGRRGRDVSITIDVFSVYEGFKEAFEIYNQIDELLDGQPLTLSNYSLVYLQNDGMQTILAQDGVTRQIPVRYRAFIQE